MFEHTHTQKYFCYLLFINIFLCDCQIFYYHSAQLCRALAHILLSALSPLLRSPCLPPFNSLFAAFADRLWNVIFVCALLLPLFRILTVSHLFLTTPTDFDRLPPLANFIVRALKNTHSCKLEVKICSIGLLNCVKCVRISDALMSARTHTHTQRHTYACIYTPLFLPCSNCLCWCVPHPKCNIWHYDVLWVELFDILLIVWLFL